MIFVLNLVRVAVLTNSKTFRKSKKVFALLYITQKYRATIKSLGMGYRFQRFVQF